MATHPLIATFASLALAAAPLAAQPTKKGTVAGRFSATVTGARTTTLLGAARTRINPDGGGTSYEIELGDGTMLTTGHVPAGARSFIPKTGTFAVHDDTEENHDDEWLVTIKIDDDDYFEAYQGSVTITSASASQVSGAFTVTARREIEDAAAMEAAQRKWYAEAMRASQARKAIPPAPEERIMKKETITVKATFTAVPRAR
jgi:hypothetical protein